MMLLAYWIATDVRRCSFFSSIWQDKSQLKRHSYISFAVFSPRFNSSFNLLFHKTCYHLSSVDVHRCVIKLLFKYDASNVSSMKIWQYFLCILIININFWYLRKKRLLTLFNFLIVCYLMNKWKNFTCNSSSFCKTLKIRNKLWYTLCRCYTCNINL